MKYVSDTNLGKFLQKLKGLFAKKSEVPSQADLDNRYLQKSGGTMTGAVKFDSTGGLIKSKTDAKLLSTGNGIYANYVSLGDNNMTIVDIQTTSTDVIHNRSGNVYNMLDAYNTAANPTLAGTEANLTGLKVNGTSYKVLQGMENPMTAANDLIIGGTSGTPTRLAKPSSFGAFRYDGSSLGYGKLSIDYLNHSSGDQYKIPYVSDNASGNMWAYGKPASDFGLGVLTTAPTAANTDGLKIVVLSSEPATRYSGFLYIITS